MIQQTKPRPDASIIIRTKNEAVWLPYCLHSIMQQEGASFEVVLVDNSSTDDTLKIIESFGLDFLSISEFKPGAALNLGIQKSCGQFVVCISGHCVPTTKSWLTALLDEFTDDSIAGVYGRQLPLPYSTDRDKRDLLTVFGLDPKRQTTDPFFHNANSAIRRDVWNVVPFDESTTNIEDRLWAKEVLSQGYQIVYTPKASVYHWHGINHDSDASRARHVVGVMERNRIYADSASEAVSGSAFKAVAVILIRDIDVTKAGLSNYLQLIESIREFFPSLMVVVLAETVGDFVSVSSDILVLQRNLQTSQDFMDTLQILQLHDEEISRECGDFSHYFLFNGNFPWRNWKSLVETYAGFDPTSSLGFLHVVRQTHSVWSSNNSSRDLSFVWSFSPPTAIEEKQSLLSLFGYGSLLPRGFGSALELSDQSMDLIEIENRLEALEVRTASEWKFLQVRERGLDV